MPEGVLGGQDDVGEQLRVGERPHLVVAAQEGGGEAAQRVGVEATRVDPLGLGRAVLPAETVHINECK